jgi:hypothetical protein
MAFSKMLESIKNPLSKFKTSSPLENLRTPLLQKRKTYEKVFYVCSFGGCGSKMLCEYLSQFGTVKHVHSRYPPTTLTAIDKHEWFSQKPIPEQALKHYYVIYIYRDPVKAILSRFTHPAHLNHIQANPHTTLPQVLATKQDLYGIENFYDNYTVPSPAVKRNYKIYCVKYEDFFQHISEFNQTFQIQCDTSQYPVERTTEKPFNIDTIALQDIYCQLREKMRKMPFLKVI